MSKPPRVALVTGAGSGIGRAVALALLRDGYEVVVTGRREQPLKETLNASGDSAARGLSIASDVKDPIAVRDLFAKTKQHFGRLDVLFNNAGRGAPPVLLEEVTFEQWQDVVGVNLTGMFLCTQEAIKIMKDQQPRGGRIINNGSISAYSPRPNSAPYTATKHAVAGLTKSTALDGRKYDIACSQIDIGNAETDLTARMTQGIIQANGTVMPEPRMDVEHVANTVLHIANLPLDANVLFMTLMATKMPYVGRG
ncbi:MAG TPA: SDR family oxidoreductase [Polyangiaceae bacterium]|nr:SDR family oxidoreductase [Polyangiaceae bacterium]